MRIIYVLSSLNPGGAERQQTDVLIHLRQAGHDGALILPYGPGVMDGNLAQYVRDHEVSTFDLSAQSEKIPAMQAVMEQFKPDVVVSCGYPMTINGSLAAYKAGVPLRVIRYENTGFTRTQFPQSWPFELVGHLVTHKFVGNSQPVVDSFAQYEGIDSSKVSVIPNGVDLPVVSKAMREQSRRHWGAGDKKLIGCLANHRPDGLKNQPVLIRAIAEVVKTHPDIKVLLVGYQTEYTSVLLAEITRLNLLDMVFLPGRIDDLDLIAGWDIAVNCSRTEGLSNAVMQGMAYGIPTICTAVGGNVDLVSNYETGLLVGDDNPAELASAICELLEDQKVAKELGAAGRRRMKEHFNWDTAIRQWLSLFDEGLKEVGHA